MNKVAEENFGVSVIIPCYNAGAFIDEAVDSVLRQETDVPFEIIIVDDCSTDAHTLDRVAHYEDENLDNIKVIRHSENGGAPVARNTAIAAARYSYILPLDADDRLVVPDRQDVNPGLLKKASDILNENSDIDVVTPQCYFFGAVEGEMRYPRMDERRMMFKNHVPLYSMIRKSTIDAIGGFNEELSAADDWDLWVAIANHRKLSGKSGGFHRIDEHLMEYRTHADGSNVSANFKLVSTEPYKKMMERSPEIFKEHFPYVPQSVLPSYLLAHKLGYLGKLGLKSLWSQNASTFMTGKKEVGIAMLKNLFSFSNGSDVKDHDIEPHQPE